MRTIGAVVSLAVIATTWAVGQAPPPGAPVTSPATIQPPAGGAPVAPPGPGAATPKNKAEGAGEAAAKPPAEATAPAKPPKPAGDTITFKKGGVLKGIQIIRETPNSYEVEIVEGSETMMLPRRQVQTVEYDDYDPIRERSLRPGPSQKREPVLLPGQEIPPELLKQLRADISEPPIKVERQDFVSIIEQVAGRAKVKITVDDSVKAMPPQERQWSFETKQGTNVMGFLDSLTAAFKSLKVVYQQDNVILTAKTAESAPKETPPAAPAAPAGAR